MQYFEELLLNTSVFFFLMVWRSHYRMDLILKVTVFVARVCEVQYREELIMNVTLFVVRFWVV